MPKLALLRHGHTSWNRDGKIQGSSDIPLDNAAREELSAFRLPRDWANAHLCASPLARAAETARIVARKEPQTVTALTEMNWGAWEGARGADLLDTPGSGFRHIEEWGWDYHAPGGESPAQLWARVRPWVDTLTQDTLAVCHIGVMRVILANAWGWDFAGPAPFAIKRNRLYLIDLATGEPDPEPVRLIRDGAAS